MPIRYMDLKKSSTSFNRLYHIRRRHHKFIFEIESATGILSESMSKYETDGKIIPAKVAAKIHGFFPDYPIWFISGADHLPETTFNEKMFKAICYHGHDFGDLADFLGISRSTLHDYRRPNNKFPAKHMQRLKEYMKILETTREWNDDLAHLDKEEECVTNLIRA